MNLIKDKLEKYGFKVKLTHDKGQLKDDERLEEYGKGGRAVISSEVKAKYLFSLHLNCASNWSFAFCISSGDNHSSRRSIADGIAEFW